LVRTIKAQYYKNGVVNFVCHRDDGFNATGVMVEYEYDCND
jgi:hypothetical protein